MVNNEYLGKLIIQHTKSPKIELLVHSLYALFMDAEYTAYILSAADNVPTYLEAIEVANAVFYDLGYTSFTIGMVYGTSFSCGNIDRWYIVLRFDRSGKIIDPHGLLSLYPVEETANCSNNG